MRRARGHPLWNLSGGSDVSLVALNYLRRHPRVVRTVTLDGDEATAVSYLYNPCVLKGGDGKVLTEGGRYHDRIVRTPDGWRLAARREEPIWNAWPPGLRP